MLVDVAHRWRLRENRAWSGIRLYVPEKSPRGSEVDTIVLHQWGAAAELSLQARGRIHRGESNEAAEWAKRCERVPYHFSATVLSDGTPLVVRAWPGEAYTNHAGSMNSRSIGVGIVGLLPRFSDDFDTALNEAVQEAVRAAAEEVRRLAPASYSARQCDAPVRLLTHSQTAAKPADPGEQIIRALAPLSPHVTETRPGYWAGDGSPWPDRWARHFS